MRPITGVLEELVPGIPATSVIFPPFYCDHGDGIRLGEHVFVGTQLHISGPEAISRLEHIRWWAPAYRLLPIIRWIIWNAVRQRDTLSGDDRRRLLDWRWCSLVSGCNGWRPLRHRCRQCGDEKAYRPTVLPSVIPAKVIRQGNEAKERREAN